MILLMVKRRYTYSIAAATDASLATGDEYDVSFLVNIDSTASPFSF